MAKRAIGTMATDAVADGSQLEFSVSEQDLERGGKPAVWVQGLDGAEQAYLWMSVGVTPAWAEVEDSSGQATFTITRKHFTIDTVGDYGITKDATAGTLTVTLEGVS